MGIDETNGKCSVGLYQDQRVILVEFALVSRAREDEVCDNLSQTHQADRSALGFTRNFAEDGACTSTLHDQTIYSKIAGLDHSHPRTWSGVEEYFGAKDDLPLAVDPAELVWRRSATPAPSIAHVTRYY
ncbi:hypothetical protein IF1G_09048 [Cordyceps javanica]|uniref:Uncharacterized protein n=1 Tax=Cordyceps javanica TaxID=43265 RepID=A0A545USV3_9HYPO|nr:hypothetical protein IF1G_09048 [Cordyceps javanica]